MSTKAIPVNPKVLTWARESAGLSITDVSKRMKKEASVIRGWEKGEAAPTYGQLEDLAYQVYKRPVAVFFFPEPPVEAQIEGHFRTLPGSEIHELDSTTRFELRNAVAFQNSIRELCGKRSMTDRLITKDIQANRGTSMLQLAREVREYLGVKLVDQQVWGSPDAALRAWRTIVEDVGVYVFKRPFKQPEVSGFCLFDQQFPLIVINNSNTFTRQIFTLFHELAHLLFRVSSVSKDDADLSKFVPENQEIEIACNRFASEFLVPRDNFPLNLFDKDDVESFVLSTTRIYSVSAEVILRRLLDCNQISQAEYIKYRKVWPADGRREGGNSGGSYYSNTGAYLSRGYMQLAFSQYWDGRINDVELASHLNVKVKNLEGLEDLVKGGE